MSKRILLTGGRAPVTLELARLFSRQGHTVFVAESMRFPITRFSRAVERHFLVPSARFETDQYVRSIEEIISTHNINLFIPTCEEVLYASKVVAPTSCVVWQDSFARLHELHNKWLFVQLVAGLNLAVPHTEYIESREQLESILATQCNPVILKPVYSRFATSTVLAKPKVSVSTAVVPTKRYPWVLQEYIDGEHFCTYSLAQNGDLLAHATYQPQERWGMGASTVFENVQDITIEEWVEKFVKKINFTGQIAFDFIRSKDGILYPIECNPRTTSGAHLFQGSRDLVDRFCGQGTGVAVPDKPFIRSIKLALYVRLGFLLWNYRSGEWKKTWHFICHSRDVLFDSKDPLPALGQFFSLAEFMLRSIRQGISPTDATSNDVSYNGGEEKL